MWASCACCQWSVRCACAWKKTKGPEQKYTPYIHLRRLKLTGRLRFFLLFFFRFDSELGPNLRHAEEACAVLRHHLRELSAFFSVSPIGVCVLHGGTGTLTTRTEFLVIHGTVFLAAC